MKQFTYTGIFEFRTEQFAAMVRAMQPTRHHRVLRPRVAFILATSFSLPLLGSTAALAERPIALPDLSAEQVDLLNAGEVLTEAIPGEAPEGFVMGVIEAPIGEVSELIVRSERYPDYMPDIEVIAEHPDHRLLRGVTRTPWPLEDRSWTIRAEYHELGLDGVDVHLITWSYVPGSGNIEDMQGHWLLIPWGADGGHTLGCYWITADLGTWLPDFAMSWAIENFLPSKIENVRTHVPHVRTSRARVADNAH